MIRTLASLAFIAPSMAFAAAPVERRAAAAAPPQQAAPAAAPAARASAAERPDWLERERTGPPYEAHGRWYAPTPEPGYREQGLAGRYPGGREGRTTASGDRYDPRGLSAAHPTLPIPSLVQVTDLSTGRELIVRVNDRGPFVEGRILALSDGAADALGVRSAAEVHVRYLGPAPVPVRVSAAASARSAPKPQARPQAAPPAAAAGYLVQAGAFGAEANARRAEARLAAVGAVRVEPRPMGGRTLWAVSVGPLPDLAAAHEARSAAARLGFADARITGG